MTEFASSATIAPEQWREWAGRNVAVTDDGLALATRPAVHATDLGVAAIDVSCNVSGFVYALRQDGGIVRHDPDPGQTEQTWTAGLTDETVDLRAICAAGDRLYVADAQSGNLLVVSERTGAIQARISAGLVDPVAIRRHRRALYVLDRSETTEADRSGGRLLVIRGFDTVTTATTELTEPIDLTIGADGTAYVLDRTDDRPVIQILELGGLRSAGDTDTASVAVPVDPETGDAIEPSCLAVGSSDTLVLGGTTVGGQAGLYRLALGDGTVHTVDRIAGFDRRCDRLVTPPHGGRGSRITYFAVVEGRVVSLTETRRNERNPTDGKFSGTAYRRIDSGSSGIQWHRVTLEFDAPPSNARVVVRYYATDDETVTDVAAIDGIDDDTADHLRANGIDGIWDLVERTPDTIARAVGDDDTDRARAWQAAAIGAIDDHPPDGWTTVGNTNPRDVLLDDAHGRYLHAAIDLVGDESESPVLASFRAYCPRQSYLRYLPELFGPDNGESAFFEEFLAVFESAYVDIEEEITAITRLFDPRGVPGESLDWLARWLAMDLPEGWPTPAKRELIERAPTLVRHRGTKRGLREVVELYLEHVTPPDTEWMAQWRRDRIDQRAAAGVITDEAATALRARIRDRDRTDNGDHLLWILEHPDLDDIPDEGAQPFARYMRGPRSFVVFAGPFVRHRHREAVERLVASDRPAHTAGAVAEVRHHCKLGGNTFLGVNSTLTPRQFELGRSTLGQDTVLGERDPFP